MHPNTPYLTLAVVASVLALSACNKPGGAPAAPAANAAAVPAAAPVVPAPAAAPTGAGEAGVQPTTTAPGAATLPERRGGRMGGRMGGGKGRGNGGLRAACAADIQRFCAGEEKVGRCLKLHVGELSQACAAAREARKEARRAGR